ncbi:hypothetical protein B0T22DRAFT_496195 [Podospora appendiculata]|uniref:Uncharacterized protein n=1 Tax=Podospora appendiculata TaxID=314037 RepID=A0AAE0XH94_9PEZI|nr:hypothetical protein B0T22DRAFT_496195 [Podospora appendiculata]
MNDPGDLSWSWPHWKFGLKRDDLFSTLHEQYNTFPSTIQDPEAFHHDVYEISNEATTTDDFYRLLRVRKEQRLRELNESLESAAFEIIGNPSLIGTEQWQHAVQLFRTRSLDSLVRFYISYLPVDHPWHKTADSSSASGRSSSVDSLTHSQDSFFDDHYDGPIMTDEPFDFSTSIKSRLPPSPRSMTMCSDSSVASPMDSQHEYELDILTPARTLSFSESEPDCFLSLPDSEADLDKKDAPQPTVPVLLAPNSVSDEADSTTYDFVESEDITAPSAKDDTLSINRSSIASVIDSETPTPKPERQATSFFDVVPSLPHRRHRSVSPSRPQPLPVMEVCSLNYDSHDDTSRRRTPTTVLGQPTRLRKRESSPVQRRRRYLGEHATRIQKPIPNANVSRPRGRRRVEC